MVELFDQAGHLSWHSPQEFSPKFAYDSALDSFLNSSGNTFDLGRGDEGNLTYLACINPSWLPVTLLVTGKEFKSPSLTMLVLARLGGFPILIFSLLLPPTDACPSLFLAFYLLP